MWKLNLNSMRTFYLEEKEKEKEKERQFIELCSTSLSSKNNMWYYLAIIDHFTLSGLNDRCLTRLSRVFILFTKQFSLPTARDVEIYLLKRRESWNIITNRVGSSFHPEKYSGLVIDELFPRLSRINKAIGREILPNTIVPVILSCLRAPSSFVTG